jgi:hypothetical protein
VVAVFDIQTSKPKRYVPPPHVTKASTAGEGYIRWPSVLVHCQWLQDKIVKPLPPGTKIALGPGELPTPKPPPKFHPSRGEDLKLLMFMVYKSAGARDGYGTARMAEVEEFMGAGITRPVIREAVLRLQEQWIRIDPFDLADGDTQFDQCKLFRFTDRRTRDQGIAWKFDSDFLIALAATHHYARLNMAAISGLDSFASLRLYAKFCYTADADHRQVWQVPVVELKAFVNSQARSDNFRLRVLEPAMDDIKSTGAFGGRIGTELVYATCRGQQLAAVNFTFSGSSRGYRNAHVEKPAEEPWPYMDELLAAADKQEAEAEQLKQEQLLAAAKAEMAKPWPVTEDILGDLLAGKYGSAPAPAGPRQVAKPDADGRIPKFIVGYIKEPKFRSQPVYHAVIPGSGGSICGTGAWIPAGGGTQVSCQKCRTLIRKATSTRPVLKLKVPKPVKPRAPSREQKLANKRAAKAAQSAAEIARLMAWTPPAPLPPPVKPPVPPVTKPTWTKRKQPASDGNL